MEEQEVVYRFTLDYLPVTYRSRATQYTFIGTRDELDQWFEATLLCGSCKDDLAELKEYSTPEEQNEVTVWNTGCGCEWDITEELERQ